MTGVLLVAALATLGCGRSAEEPPVLRVAAASSLARPLSKLAAAFDETHPGTMAISLGSSGKLAMQIREGAPFDVFLSADKKWIDAVIGSGRTDGQVPSFAQGTLVLWVPGTEVPSLADLADPRWTKIAMANPEHAPYGRAAVECLKSADVWETVRGKAVYGANVRHALQFAETRNADVALTALATVIGRPGRYTILDSSLHQPLDQFAVRLTDGSQPDLAREFIEFLRSQRAVDIVAEYGYTAARSR